MVNTWNKLWNKIKANYIWLFFVLLLFIGIKDYELQNLLSCFWIEPIARKFDFDIWVGLLCIAFIAVLFYNKTDFFRSPVILFLTIILVLCLWKTYGYWSFKAAYWVPALLQFILYMIFVNLLEDSEPELIAPVEDQFKRRSFAKSIIEDIVSKKINTEYPWENNSFNYGFIGKWGSGKTRLMKLIEEEIFEHNKSNREGKDLHLISVFYRPWEAPSEDRFVRDILEGIRLKSNNQEIKTLITQYLQKIEQDSNSLGLKIFTTIVQNLFFKEKTIQELKSELCSILQKKKTRIVVFLDDLDRLQKDEMLEVFRLLRNTFDIGGLFFIVGYDEDYVNDQLNLNGRKAEYLAKFFQVRVDIPVAAREALERKYLASEAMVDIFKDKDDLIYPRFESFEEEIKNQIGENHVKLINSPRDFELISNSFQIIYANLGKNCNPYTLLQLEILRHFDRKLYEEIKINPSVLEIKNPIANPPRQRIVEIQKASYFSKSFSILDHKYAKKYFTYVNAIYEIDQIDFDKAILGEHINKNLIMDWFNEGKDWDFEIKLETFFKNNYNIKATKILEIQRCFKSSYNKRNDFEQFIKSYLMRECVRIPDSSIFRELVENLDDAYIEKEVCYYFFVKDFDQTIGNIICEKFKELVERNNVEAYKIRDFVMNVYSMVYYSNNKGDLISSQDRNREVGVLQTLEPHIVRFIKNEPILFIDGFVKKYDYSLDSPSNHGFDEYVYNLVNDIGIENLTNSIGNFEDEYPKKREEYVLFLRKMASSKIIQFTFQHHPFYRL